MNPLLLIKFGPYLAIALLLSAWGIQTHRLTGTQQEFLQYKLEQQLLIQQQIDLATVQRKKTSDDFLQTKAALEKAIATGDAYRRCVLAGRCGVVRAAPSCPDPGIQTARSADDRSPDAVPAPTGDAAINDCALTTLMINKLQADIEAQPGYKD